MILNIYYYLNILEFRVAVRAEIKGAGSCTNTDKTFGGQTRDRNRES